MYLKWVTIHFLHFVIRFLSSYNSRFSIKRDLDRIQQQSPSLDETRVEFIMAAVDSAREAFPSHLSKKNNVAEQHHGPTCDNNTVVTMNGQLEGWTEENAGDEKAFVEERVKNGSTILDKTR